MNSTTEVKLFVPIFWLLTQNFKNESNKDKRNELFEANPIKTSLKLCIKPMGPPIEETQPWQTCLGRENIC